MLKRQTAAIGPKSRKAQARGGAAIRASSDTTGS
jgi:hypothetical protein